jgi:anti-anti-sigma factor
MSATHAGPMSLGTVVQPPWEQLDLASSGLLRALLEQTRRPGTAVVLDLSCVVFVDSSALGVLAAAHRRLLAEGHPLVLTNVDPRVLRVLRLTGLLGQLRTTEAPAPAAQDAPFGGPRRRP